MFKKKKQLLGLSGYANITNEWEIIMKNSLLMCRKICPCMMYSSKGSWKLRKYKQAQGDTFDNLKPVKDLYKNDLWKT